MPLQPGITPQPHQQRMFDEAAQASAAGEPFRKLYLWGLGSGKSFGALGTVDRLGGSAAFVVPAALRPTIKNEQQKFLGRGDIPVFSYQGAAAGKVPPVDTLAADEVQRITSRNSAQAEAVARLAEGAKNVVLLSGTPIRNSPAEFAPIMSALTGKPITHEQFADRYIGTEKVRPGLFGRLRGARTVEQPAIVHQDELKALLDGHIDYYSPDKPPVDVTEETHEAEMTPRQSELYAGMFGRLPLLLRWKLKHQYPMSNEEMQRMRSFLTGPRQVALSDLPYRADKDPYRAFLNSGKLTKAFDLLKQSLGKSSKHKAIVYSNFLEAGLRPYAAALAKEGIPHATFHGGLSDQERKKLVDDFNEGRLRVALVAPAGSEGISLKGAQLLQVLDKHWNQARTQQAVGRGIRFDSHVGLPDDLKQMTVQGFHSRVPLTRWERLAALAGWRPDVSPQRKTVDHYLDEMSQRKKTLNDQFLNLLKEIGTSRPAPSAPAR